MKRKTNIYTSIIIIILLASIIFIANKIIEKKKGEEIIATIPELSFFTIIKKPFSNNNVDLTKSRIIINHFNPTCEHCQYMASEFLKDSQRLKNIQILMITSADSLNISKFISDYKLSLQPNIIILRDTSFQFQKTFGTGIVPSFFIYEHNKLVKKIVGETLINNLVN
jgi:thiol-disulfide isomerase/thioredoxin